MRLLTASLRRRRRYTALCCALATAGALVVTVRPLPTRAAAPDRAEVEPVLAYSTYLGGSLDDQATAIAVDAFGNVFVAGSTLATDFPTHNASYHTHQGKSDVFVTKLSATGEVIYSLDLGGSEDDFASAIAVDASGCAYVTGSTKSADFPTTIDAYDGTYNGFADAFVAKLDSNFGSVVWSTYLGGTSTDTAQGVAVDQSGSVYVTGFTNSADLPTLNPLQRSYAGNGDAFVTKLDASAPGAAALLYSTFLGGDQDDVSWDVAVDASGFAYLAGHTNSTNFPFRNGFQLLQSPASGDAFVTKLNCSASGDASLLYSTYLGGDGGDQAFAVAADGSGNVYITGRTTSADFPVRDPFQGTRGSFQDAFVAKLDPSATGLPSLLYSTYLGGAGDSEVGFGIAVDGSGQVCVAGSTASVDFPTRNALQGGYAGGGDVFVAKLDPSVASVPSLVASSYLGGESLDAGWCVAADARGGVYLAGSTYSSGFPTVGAFQDQQGGSDAFVAKIADAAADVSVTQSCSPDPVTSGSELTCTIIVANAGPDAAQSVVVRDAIPPGASYVASASSQGESQFSPDLGEVSCALGTIPAGGSATLTIVLAVSAEAGAVVENTASVSSATPDPSPDDNTATCEAAVIAAVTPPTVSEVTSVQQPGRPYRVRIVGDNFKFGVQVFIGSDTAPWPGTRHISSTVLVLKGGRTLQSKFPLDVAVPLRIVNPDGGEVRITFTR
jgi:uncharacterized repeat protein (TIGR01451 family)